MRPLRVTPLNLFAAALMVGIAYLLLFPDGNGWRVLGSVSLFLLLLISALTDLLFRLKFKSIKQIWIVECLFLIFVVLLIYFIRGF